MPSNGFQVWEVDAPTLEKFFLELAQENPVRFTAQQLCAFTDNYSTVLGSGGFGRVYKRKFPNGVKIAVKVLNRGPNRNIEEQFMAEVGTIGRTHHINRVRLYGFCYDHFMSALVYEFMENGHFGGHLFGENQELEWSQLHEIAVGTAKGIAYLHEECQQRIIHYNIKPGNVLLDGKFSPKFWDSLFEIVGRRKTRKTGGNGDDSLDWFPKKVWEEFEKGELMKLREIVGLRRKIELKAERMAMVALWCALDSPDARLPMSVVVKMLEGGVEIVSPHKPFHYLFSVGTNVLKPPSGSESGSGYTTSDGTNSYWYKETTTPIMAKYEITVATL
ncbi:hypothetical protein DH2020_024498 [Rehmannia glutinosa]|uniref:Protein kinase domain-containing protein n=1 Tax=Rehmannia glutinosa TaxID=99300 RepID=A0ABR0W360_REHGL